MKAEELLPQQVHGDVVVCREVAQISQRIQMMRFLIPLLLSGCFVLLAGAARAESRYSFTAGGNEVTDSQTGLIWRRCAEGMTWTGTTCAGSPKLLSREQALAHAKAQAGWRLPNVKELASILQFDRAPSAIDADAFPGTPALEHWTSSPYLGLPGSAWVVGFDAGYVAFSGNAMSHPVRLVR